MLSRRLQWDICSALQDKAVGPHPEANLEVLFTRESYTLMLNYLAFALPTTFSALIHQLTADQVRRQPALVCIAAIAFVSLGSGTCVTCHVMQEPQWQGSSLQLALLWCTES